MRVLIGRRDHRTQARHDEERHQDLHLDVSFLRLGPKRILRAHDRKVVGVELERVLRTFDEQGRFGPRFDSEDRVALGGGHDHPRDGANGVDIARVPKAGVMPGQSASIKIKLPGDFPEGDSPIPVPGKSMFVLHRARIFKERTSPSEGLADRTAWANETLVF